MPQEPSSLSGKLPAKYHGEFKSVIRLSNAVYLGGTLVARTPRTRLHRVAESLNMGVPHALIDSVNIPPGLDQRLRFNLLYSTKVGNPPVSQVVFYQSGVGTFGDKVIEELDGIVGASLGEKVQEAYAFIAHNYAPGDEASDFIFLFGFSRGAYTARMVADLIRAIGVLDRTEMDSFADIFVAYQKRGKAQDQAQIETLDRQLAPWTRHDSPGKLRADFNDHTFSVKCVGVFDTVGSVGLPEELTHSQKVKTLLGFRDLDLGAHVERGYQALALDEHRADFNCAKWSQTEAGRRKGQILKQCWFSGSHCDVGGGFRDHDLSDLTLAWLAANISDILLLDADYLAGLPDPCAPWGALPPHNSISGLYLLANTCQRTIPTETDAVTHEYIHPSALRQEKVNPEVLRVVQDNPEIIWQLLPLEQVVKDNWHVIREPSDIQQKSKDEETVVKLLTTVKQDIVKTGHNVMAKVTHSQTSTTTTTTRDPRANLLIRAMNESNMGSLVRNLVEAPEAER
ncbi:hypothetical protein NM688_g1306 [Phlebia brevispora]|uniref:Uncharacterized protein n=1 Tax=Phlebia brevispora TaxID=194682 RepID=A0ACC1TBQ7_9APHY|nr:hypothetical protein NM688_g1306 [Phlebia brevispora]